MGRPELDSFDWAQSSLRVTNEESRWTSGLRLIFIGLDVFHRAEISPIGRTNRVCGQT